MKVLVVDDDRTLADLMADMLREQGHQPVAAYHGREGLQACRRMAFDVAIVDIVMPGMDGIEVIQALRQDHPGVRIIAISGMRDHAGDYLRMARKLGADQALEKPFAFAELVALAERLAARG